MKGVDKVYICAGALGTTELSHNAYAAVAVNISVTLNVSNVAMEHNANRMIYCTTPSIWLNIYSITKKAVSYICMVYKKRFGFDVHVMRVLNAFGPDQHLFPVRTIVPIFTQQAMHHLTSEIWGSGEQFFDLVYSEDAAKIAIDNIQLEHMKNDGLDVDAASRVTVGELAHKVIGQINLKSNLRHFPMRRGEDDGTYLRDSNACHRTCTTNLATGLQKAISYFSNLHESILQRAIEFYYGRSGAAESDLTIQAPNLLESFSSRIPAPSRSPSATRKTSEEPVLNCKDSIS